MVKNTGGGLLTTPELGSNLAVEADEMPRWNSGQKNYDIYRSSLRFIYVYTYI